MNRRWFVEIEGRAQGPFETSQVEDLIKLRKLTPLSRVFAEGDVRWRVVSECSELTPYAAPVDSVVENRDWVVLKRKSFKEAETSKNKFDQIGPFSQTEVHDLLKAGELSYTDYAWKKGFQRWAKLETLPEFNHLVQRPAFQATIEVKTAGISFVQEPKLELNEQEQDELDQFTVTQPNGIRAIEEEIGKAAVTESKAVLAVNRAKALRVAVASAIACFATVAVYDAVKNKFAHPPPVVAQQTVPSAPLSPDEPPVVESVTKAPPSQLAPPVADNQAIPKKPKLDIEILRSAQTVAQIVLSTNAPMNTRLEVKISGRSGQILRYASYTQNLTIQRQGGELPSIQLSSLRLPSGTYTVQARYGDIVRQKTFFYGVQDAKFQKQLEAHLKAISAQQTSEKKAVFYYLRSLETLTKNLEAERAKSAQNPARWLKAYKTWRTEIRKASQKTFSPFNQMNSREIAYPEILARARELAVNLLSQGEELNAMMVQNRYISSTGVGPILAAIRDFKKEVSVLSRY